MAKQQFFIAGTDTDVGKTVVTAALLEAANRQGLRTLGMKPVAAGCEPSDQGLRNEDALLIQQAMSESLPYEQLNPVALAPAIAPHIAAQQAGLQLQADRLAGYCRGVMAQPADFLLIEGAGGWRVPLNERETLADLAIGLQLPVILVVAMRLGCINHALLTAEAIAGDGLPLAGWVANTTGNTMSCYRDNIQTLQSLLDAPLLGEVPCLAIPDAVTVAEYLTIDPLLG